MCLGQRQPIILTLCGIKPSSFVAYLTANALCFVCLAQTQLPCMDLVMYCK